MGDFAAAVGVAYHHGVLDVEVREELFQVVDKGVHVVACPGLRGAAMASTVVGDDAVALVGEEDHLVFEVVAA